MAKAITDENVLNDIADEINIKNGTNVKYKDSELANAVANIKTEVGGVISVNGQTGVVRLTAKDVEAIPSSGGSVGQVPIKAEDGSAAWSDIPTEVITEKLFYEDDHQMGHEGQYLYTFDGKTKNEVFSNFSQALEKGKTARLILQHKDLLSTVRYGPEIFLYGRKFTNGSTQTTTLTFFGWSSIYSGYIEAPCVTLTQSFGMSLPDGTYPVNVRLSFYNAVLAEGSGTTGQVLTKKADGKATWQDAMSQVYHVGTTSPTNTKLLWIDTTNGSVLKYHNGSDWVATNAVWGG